MNGEVIIAISTCGFMLLLFLYSYRAGILGEIYRKCILPRGELYEIDKEEKTKDCANSIRNSVAFFGIMGECNGKFWNNKELLESLDYFLANNHRMELVVGPYFDIESKELLKKIIEGMDKGNVRLLFSKERMPHHLKKFVDKNGRVKIVVEKPHPPLSRGRGPLLVCVNDEDFNMRVQEEFDKVYKCTEELSKEEIIKKFTFIKYDECGAGGYKIVSNDEINELSKYLYKK